MGTEKVRAEEFRASGDELLAKVKELVREGNVRRVVIKNDAGKVRIPMKSSTCSDHAVHCRSEATPASTLYSQVVDMGKGESTFRRDSPCRLSR